MHVCSAIDVTVHRDPQAQKRATARFTFSGLRPVRASPEVPDTGSP